MPKPIKNPLDFYREIGSHVMENEHGWLNYYINSDGNCYLENLYIYPESRKSQKFTSLLSCLELQAVELHGCKMLFTSINRHIPQVDINLQIALKRGFKFHLSNNDAIILKKEL